MELTAGLVAEHNCKYYRNTGSRVQLRSAFDGTTQYTWADFTDPWGVPATRTVSDILEAPRWLKRESDDKKWEIVPDNQRPNAMADEDQRVWMTIATGKNTIVGTMGPRAWVLKTEITQIKIECEEKPVTDTPPTPPPKACQHGVF